MDDSAEIQRQTAIFSPEGIMMLTIFGIIDIIDFFIGSFFLLDLIALLIYLLWIYFRRQTTDAGEALEKISEIRSEREGLKERLKAKKTAVAKKGKWLRWGLFFLEWIPIVGIIPGWTFMAYSELKS